MWQSPQGNSNFWDLVCVVCGADGSELSANYRRGIMHMKHILKFKSVSTRFMCMRICMVFWLCNYYVTAVLWFNLWWKFYLNFTINTRS